MPRYHNGNQHSHYLIDFFQQFTIVNREGIDLPLLNCEIKESDSGMFTMRKKDFINNFVRYFLFVDNRTNTYFIVFNQYYRKSAKSGIRLNHVMNVRLFQSKQLFKIFEELKRLSVKYAKPNLLVKTIYNPWLLESPELFKEIREVSIIW